MGKLTTPARKAPPARKPEPSDRRSEANKNRAADAVVARLSKPTPVK